MSHGTDRLYFDDDYFSIVKSWCYLTIYQQNQNVPTSFCQTHVSRSPCGGWRERARSQACNSFILDRLFLGRECRRNQLYTTLKIKGLQYQVFGMCNACQKKLRNSSSRLMQSPTDGGGRALSLFRRACCCAKASKIVEWTWVNVYI